MTTKSFTSQVSYFAGMIFTAAFRGRERLGEEPWLDDEAADGVLARVVVEARVGCELVAECSARIRGICGGICGSGGGGAATGGDKERSFLLPRAFGTSDSVGIGGRGGEYCVPASTNCLRGEQDDLIEEEWDLLCGLGTILRD